MAMKPIRDITFKEFSEWANDRACDGRWSIFMAITCCNAVKEVMCVKPLFGRRKAREQAWERIKAKYFELDGKLDV